MKEHFFLAFRNLRRRGIRSWLTLLGIFIGIAAVVSLVSLGNGLRTAVNSQFGISSTEVISVQAGGLNNFGPPGSGAVDLLTKEDAEAIEKLSSVERVVTRNIETFKMEFNENLGVTVGFNIPDGDDRKFSYEIQELEAEYGRMLRDGDSGKVVLGANFGLKENGFEKEIEIGDNVKIQEENFEVVGILEKKGSFIFDNAIMMNSNDLERLGEIEDEVDVIAVKVKSKDLMERAKEDIEELLRKRRGVKEGEENFEVSTPQASLDTINQILLGVQIFIVMIASISIIVGGLGIVNTMTTSVLERKKEIGIMKAIGARNKDIFLQFFIEAGLLGLVGGGIGILLGSALGYIGTGVINNFLGATATPQISLTLIIFSLAGSFVIGAISGIVPAMRAAGHKPVEALRG